MNAPTSGPGPRLGAMATAAMLLLGSGTATALDTTIDFGLSGEYTNNTTLAETDEIGEWIYTPSVDIGLTQSGAALELDAGYRVERRIYERDLFDDETAIRGTAEAIWHALPERLDLTARNIRSETTIRATDPNTEANRQTVSIIELGPTLRLRPRSNAEFQLEYLYSDVRVEETDTDSERHTGAARYLINLSAIRSVEFEARFTDVDFDNPLAPDLETRVGSVTFVHAGGNVNYSLMGGYNQTRRTQGRDDVDGGIFTAGIEWLVSADTSLELEASRDIRDSSSTLLTGGGGFADSIDEDTDLNEVFIESRGRVSLIHRIGANELSVSLSASEEDYEDVSRDSERVSLRLQARRDINPRTTLSAFIDVGTREFVDEGVEFDEITAAVELSRRLSRRFGLSLAALYNERDSDDPSAISYDEWVGRLTLTYNLVGPSR
jgi:hypothetical protein